jgi:putative PIN family toxin of toxin-antitoxin system
MRSVLDTNIIIGAYTAPHGTLAKIVSFWRERAFEVLVSEPMLAEYERALGYTHVQAVHRMTEKEIAKVISSFREFATVIEPDIQLDIVKDDPDDNIFFECAVAGGAEVIVSGDKNHVLAVKEYNGIQVLSPAQFLAVLEEEIVSV